MEHHLLIWSAAQPQRPSSDCMLGICPLGWGLSPSGVGHLYVRNGVSVKIAKLMPKGLAEVTVWWVSDRWESDT